MHRLELLTGLPIHERFRKAGTILTVVAKPDTGAENPVQIGKGLADLLKRQGRARLAVTSEGKGDAGGKRG